MKMIKMALLGGAAMAVTAAGAQADDLEALKAQIETLNARVAAMETAPAVPAGYALVAISEGDLPQTPGLEMSARDKAAYGNKATVISVLPTADAPAGTTITWSGFARAGLVYSNESVESTGKLSSDAAMYADWATDGEASEFCVDGDGNDNGKCKVTNDGVEVELRDSDDDDIDVKARGQLRVNATTDTAVGEVGVDIRMRANFNGNGAGDVYSDVAWGYWAMTPEVTFGGGYAGSLGNIGYGYDGACTCYYTDNADVAFDPGDVSQMRLAYGSGPFSMALALEDASIRAGGDNFNADDTLNGDKLGAAGEIKYSGDTFSGELSGVWRNIDDNGSGIDSLWQVGAGIGFALGEIANLSLAAATGEGPATYTVDGNITQLISKIPYEQSWWGVSALASMNLNDEIHAELAAGYKNREGKSFDIETEGNVNWDSDGVEYETYAVMGGLYYDPVDQLTIGVEGEWYTTSADVELDGREDEAGTIKLERDTDNFSIDLVSVWRF